MSAQWPRQMAKLVQIVLGIGLLFFFVYEFGLHLLKIHFECTETKRKSKPTSMV